MSAFDVSGTNTELANVDPLVNVLKKFEASKRNSGRSSALVIVAAILALPLGLIAGPFGPIFWLFSVVVLTQLILIAVHELGHLAAAWVAGFKARYERRLLEIFP